MRYLTAGESHGKKLTGILEGIPAGLLIDFDKIKHELLRRRYGYGRSQRMSLEQDNFEILSGINKKNITLGTPIAFTIDNICNKEPLENTVFRPGHADFCGMVKYNYSSSVSVSERSSARITASEVFIGAILKQFLAFLDIDVISYVTRIGDVICESANEKAKGFYNAVESDAVRCPLPEASGKMIALIDEAKKEGDTLGGEVKIILRNMPAGLGSYVFWDRRLEGKLASMLISIPSVKGIRIGEDVKRLFKGSVYQDEIFLNKDNNMYRKTNNCGGIEGGISNGEEISIYLEIKPVPTLRNGLSSVDFIEKKQSKAPYIRSDVCVVPAIGVIGESKAAIVIAEEILDMVGGDYIEEVKDRLGAKVKLWKK